MRQKRDQFGDYDYILEITPIFIVNMIKFRVFSTWIPPDNWSQKGFFKEQNKPW